MSDGLIWYVTDEEYEAIKELYTPMPAEVTDAIAKANRERRK